MAHITVSKDKIIVTLDDECHEGIDGEYDANDPNDIPLMRFSVDIKKGREMEAVEDASYCTQIDARLPVKELRRLARLILDEVYPPLIHRLKHGHDDVSVKKTCERLSWINATWGTKNEKQGWILG